MEHIWKLLSEMATFVFPQHDFDHPCIESSQSFLYFIII